MNKKKKILFIENRFTQLNLEKIAKNLLEKNTEIHWIVQNHSFQSNIGKNHIIKYPKVSDLSSKISKQFLEISKKDRACNFFNGNPSHYNYYSKEIKKILTDVKPDMIFGEATLFHELITIHHAKKLQIKYLFLSSSRFISGRVTFYINDTMVPFKGSKDKISKKNILNYIENIKNIKKSKIFNGIIERLKIDKKNSLNFTKRSKIYLSRLMGEKYNTPGLIRKLILILNSIYLNYNWKKSKKINNTFFKKKKTFSVLFPMQMQPEQNIDVWGFPYNRQYEFIDKLAKSLNKLNANLYLKKNPKSKYEISNSLFKVIQSNNNIFLINEKYKMSEVIKYFDLIISITGSVIHEAMVYKIPVATTCRHKLFNANGIYYLKNLDMLNILVNNIKNKKYRFANKQDCIKLLKFIYERSYSINYHNYLLNKSDEVIKIANIIKKF